MKQIGYDKPLFVQPFDHRGSFTKKFFNLKGAPRIEPGLDERSPICAAKTMIYRGLLRAIEMGVPREHVGILVDSEFGSTVLADAKEQGIPTAVCVEKSGQPVFDFEYGPGWANHIRFVAPSIVKCLVRYHPADDPLANREQLTRLKLLSDFLHDSDSCYFMFELLVPATTEEEKNLGAAYDTEVRPKRMIEAIAEIQDFGVEPDIWKIEGLDSRADAEAVTAQTRNTRERSRVGNIILGRGSDKKSVHRWLATGATVPGYIGFAVGRTNFAEPVKRFIADPSTAAEGIEEIARNYKGCCDVWLAG